MIPRNFLTMCESRAPHFEVQANNRCSFFCRSS